MKKFRQQIINFQTYCSRFGLVGAWDILRQRRKEREIVIRVRGYSEPFRCRDMGSDFAMLTGVIGNHELDIDLVASPSLIVDAGANVGFATRSFHQRYPHAKILSIEPDIENCRQFKRNVQDISSVELRKAALWWCDGYVVIANPTAKSASFQVRDAEESDGAIPAITVKEIVRNYGDIDILKMDIEGAERQVFSQGDQEWLDHVKVLVIEVHEKAFPGTNQLIERSLCNREYCSYRQGEYLVIDLQPDSIVRGTL